MTNWIMAAIRHSATAIVAVAAHEYMADNLIYWKLYVAYIQGGTI